MAPLIAVLHLFLGSLLVRHLRRIELTNDKLQFSRYISTPSTTTATSSDLEPPSAPPPPPPPLNIPPSRARRQLAARLALHSNQNAEANLETSEAEKEHRKNLNPFATEEDDDSDDEHKDFTIGDLEVEEEGRGHPPAGTGLVGKHEPLLGGDGSQEKNVGIEHLAANSSSTSSVDTGSLWNGSSAGSSSDRRSRTKFPLLWAFGAKMEGLDWNRHQSKGASKTHADHYQFQSSDSDSDEDTNDFGREGQACRGKRRLSVTTEAKRRTSLEDEDEDDEVVHVALTEAAEELRWDVGGVAHVQRKEKSDTEGEADDGEMVDHHHAE
jgi:hypothetical protein